MLPIQKPTLLLDEHRVRRNIRHMADRALQNKVRFRPHFKTHQSAPIGDWFREVGVEAITVSSVSMARYFANHGWSDITIAFPVNILEIDRINQLAGAIRLGLLVESEETVQFLGNRLTAPANIWIKMDIGYGRTGVDWQDTDALDALATRINEVEQLSLSGVLTHAGHTYQARSTSAIEVIYQDMVFKMKGARARLQQIGADQVEISIGDTPSCSVVENLGDVDEIRPGNFVFFDVMQYEIGACREADIGVGLACPVVAKHPEKRKIVVYGGAVHLSKEALVLNDGRQIFGYVAPLTENGWGKRLKTAYVSGLSQEHGLITIEHADTLDEIKIGDVLVVLPVHSCLTANLMRKYRTLKGDMIEIGDLDAA